jgi:hypothetical protein
MKKLIASTLGLEISELDDYRYQPTRTSRPIYAIYDFYIASGIKPPKDVVGQPWEKYPDQFWATDKTVIWWSKAKLTTNT